MSLHLAQYRLHPQNTPTPARPAQDPFTVLTVRLRDALLSQRTTAIWQPEKSKNVSDCSYRSGVSCSSFDQNFGISRRSLDVRFPPRKIPLSQDLRIPHFLP